MKKTVVVTVEVEVEIDETKFDENFLEEFRSYMYQFDSIDEHIEHLAQLAARGLGGGFIEGYGEPKDMGIRFMVHDADTEIIE